MPQHTQLMNVGLLYTPVSIFQMTRGALVLFVGILSVLFLQRRLHLYQWFALIVVMGGVAVVGLSGSLVKNALREHGPDLTQLEEENDGPPPETSVLIGALFRFIVSCLPACLSACLPAFCLPFAQLPTRLNARRKEVFAAAEFGILFARSFFRTMTFSYKLKNVSLPPGPLRFQAPTHVSLCCRKCLRIDR